MRSFPRKIFNYSCTSTWSRTTDTGPKICIIVFWWRQIRITCTTQTLFNETYKTKFYCSWIHIQLQLPINPRMGALLPLKQLNSATFMQTLKLLNAIIKWNHFAIRSQPFSCGERINNCCFSLSVMIIFFP